MKINKKIKSASIISATALLLASSIASAQETKYYFVIPGVQMSSAATEPAGPVANEQVNTWSELLAQFPSINAYDYDGGGDNWSLFQASNEDTLVNLPFDIYPSANPAIIDIRNTGIVDISSFSSLASVGQLYLVDNKINDLSPLSGALSGPGTEIDLSGNNFTNVNALSRLESIAGPLRLDRNPALVDLTGLGDSAGGSNPGGRTQAIEASSGIFIDSGISLRAGFVPIPGTSYMCNAFYQDTFMLAPQSEVCEVVW